MRTLVGLTLFMGFLGAPARAADQPPLAQILEGVAAYVRQFEQDFAIVLSDEDYQQKSTVKPAVKGKGRTTQKIRSEMLFAWVPEQQSWLTVRNVLAVNGKPVADSKNRMDLAFNGPVSSRMTRLRRLRDEGARFNIGRIYRNFNDPTLVLQFLDPAHQGRFTFSMLGREKVNGIDTWKISFDERERPTIIQTSRSDLPSGGTVWISRSGGVVVRTSLTLRLHASSIRADIMVDYRQDRKLNLWVPTRMTERYVQYGVAPRASKGTPSGPEPNEEQIDCVATYSNFRRFETSGRLIPPPAEDEAPPPGGKTPEK